MAHTVSVIRMRSLSESLFGSFSNPKAGIPLIESQLLPITYEMYIIPDLGRGESTPTELSVEKVEPLRGPG